MPALRLRHRVRAAPLEERDRFEIGPKQLYGHGEGQDEQESLVEDKLENQLSDKIYFCIFAHVVFYSQNKSITWDQTFRE